MVSPFLPYGLFRVEAQTSLVLNIRWRAPQKGCQISRLPRMAKHLLPSKNYRFSAYSPRRRESRLLTEVNHDLALMGSMGTGLTIIALSKNGPICRLTAGGFATAPRSDTGITQRSARQHRRRALSDPGPLPSRGYRRHDGLSRARNCQKRHSVRQLAVFTTSYRQKQTILYKLLRVQQTKNGPAMLSNRNHP
jgi:hypothetical protein